MKPAHHQEGTGRLRGDSGGGINVEAEGVSLQHSDRAVHRPSRSQPNSEAVHPIGHAEQAGQVGQVHAQVALALRDLGRVRARLVDGGYHSELPHGVGRGTEPDRVTQVEGELLGQTALDGHGGKLRDGGDREEGGQVQQPEQAERHHCRYTTSARRTGRHAEERSKSNRRN